ncbi:MAG TPA: BatD family protein, partial [Chitinophagaceae bacterium]
MSCWVSAQNPFKTIVPRQPVVPGESFQVQYIIQEAEKIANFKAPAFTHFRFVSGPNQYSGSLTTTNGIKPIRNFVYTLEAIDPGLFTIQGATAIVDGRLVRSNDVILEV